MTCKLDILWFYFRDFLNIFIHFVQDCKHVPQLSVVLVSLLLTLDIFNTLASVSIVNFEQVIVSWDLSFLFYR